MPASSTPDEISIEFHHIQMYADSLKPVEHYKSLEKQSNEFSKEWDNGSVAKGKEVFEKVTGTPSKPEAYASYGQDVVEQLITGIGFRIVASHAGTGSRSVLLRSADESGVKFVVTAKDDSEQDAKRRKTADPQKYDHFDSRHLDRFFKSHAGRPGVAVMAFSLEPGHCDRVLSQYKKKHPALLVPNGYHSYNDGSVKVLDVFAYYHPNSTKQDEGTVLRFIEFKNPADKTQPMPGFVKEEATHSLVVHAYSDHWVSNVHDRKGFISTLTDTLGFIPKVDFNAGVVAAGEAIIESTVIGNDIDIKIDDEAEMLVNQQQVFLPINNALSGFGHVHGFLEEIGQGIQHLASRVKDLVSFIDRTNRIRESCGAGFAFLRIPRSYYGRLTQAQLTESMGASGTTTFSQKMMDALESSGAMDSGGIVLLDITDEHIHKAAADLTGADAKTWTEHADTLTAAVKRSRYANLIKLLKDHLSEDTYLTIVRTNVLVDIQGNDVLYQIFTAPIMQRKAGDEAPFLEFIQRVCSEQKDECGKPKPIKPGCGGFGIRNFLTLFLSIEVSKAMLALEKAKESGNTVEEAKFRDMVETFTAQLDESNPILTTISDAMTSQGDCLDMLKKTTDEIKRAELKKEAAKQEAIKVNANEALKVCSAKYKAMMVKLRDGN